MSLLFICDGNVARSQETELYFNLLRNAHDPIATSAGVNVSEGKPIDPKVVAVMGEQGISMEHAYRKQLTESMAERSDGIISFKPADELPEYVLSKQVIYWDIPDPRFEDMDFHRDVRDEIKSRVQQLISELHRMK